MKKCPFCKADIQENARFCLYCMKPLAEKEVIPPKKKKPKLWILIVIGAILAVILCVFLARLLKKEPPVQLQNDTAGTNTTTALEQSTEENTKPVDTPAETTQPQAIPGESEPHQATEPSTAPVSEATEDSPEPTKPTTVQSQEAPIETNPSQSTVHTTVPTTVPTVGPSQPTPPTESSKPVSSVEPTQCQHRYSLTETQPASCTTAGSMTYICTQCGHSYQQSLAATGHRYVEATCLLPKTCTVCGSTSGTALGHSYTEGFCIRCNAADKTLSENNVVYTYRTAQYGDTLNAHYTNDGNDIVITGVEITSAQGEYDIPSYINGKRVVAIMPHAFSGINTKSIVVGNTIRVIWDYAFADCTGLTDIYFCGSKIDVDPTAFAPATQRTSTLTIHCSSSCHNSNMLSYKSAAEYWYDAQYQEWNGEL